MRQQIINKLQALYTIRKITKKHVTQYANDVSKIIKKFPEDSKLDLSQMKLNLNGFNVLRQVAESDYQLKQLKLPEMFVAGESEKALRLAIEKGLSDNKTIDSLMPKIEGVLLKIQPKVTTLKSKFIIESLRDEEIGLSEVSEKKLSQVVIDFYNKGFVKLVQQAKEKFLADDGVQSVSGTDFKLTTLDWNGQQYKFYGISKTKQGLPTAENLEKISHCTPSLFEAMNFPKDTKTTQVIGDSAYFMQEESKFALRFLKDYLTKLNKKDKHLFLYGFTGHFLEEQQLDVNELLTQIISENPSLSKQFMANLVGHHSLEAIKNWGCSY